MLNCEFGSVGNVDVTVARILKLLTVFLCFYFLERVFEAAVL